MTSSLEEFFDSVTDYEERDLVYDKKLYRVILWNNGRQPEYFKIYAHLEKAGSYSGVLAIGRAMAHYSLFVRTSQAIFRAMGIKGTETEMHKALNGLMLYGTVGRSLIREDLIAPADNPIIIHVGHIVKSLTGTYPSIRAILPRESAVVASQSVPSPTSSQLTWMYKELEQKRSKSGLAPHVRRSTKLGCTVLTMPAPKNGFHILPTQILIECLRPYGNFWLPHGRGARLLNVYSLLGWKLESVESICVEELSYEQAMKLSNQLTQLLKSSNWL